MTRLDWKQGRFNVNFETDQINAALRGWEYGNGDQIDYYRFQAEKTQVNDVYDEGYGIGRVFDGPFTLDVLHAIHQEGANENTDTGFYFNDDLHVSAVYNVLMRLGLTSMDLDTGGYLKDRIVYDNKVFRVTNIQILGQIQRRDIICAIDATQVKPDELANDLQFRKWSDEPQGWG